MFPQIIKSESKNFFLMAGPCVIENDEMPFMIAEKLIKITKQLDIPFIFKASYKKANRSKMDSFTGIGDVRGLEILAEIRKKYEVLVVTDVHNEEEAVMAAEYVDVLQIPAFLCRQTELLIAAGRTGKCVNIKKGQFLSPESMEFAVNKIINTGNSDVMLTERGTTFGYGDLVIDFRGIPTMQKLNVPVILDATHSLQQPNQSSGVTGGRPDMIEAMCKAGVAVGIDGLFIETHHDPSLAKSDGANMLRLELMEDLLQKLTRLRAAIL